jgi:hypothetical protein
MPGNAGYCAKAMSYIFVSYSSVDRPRAELVVRALEKFGWSVWWDTRIDAGERFDRVIEAALESARCCVVLWSRNSVNSNWVRAEAERAFKRNILVAALLDDAEIPLPFNLIQTSSLSTWSGALKSPQFERLAQSIKTILNQSARSSSVSTDGSSAAAVDSSLLAREAVAGPGDPRSFPTSKGLDPVLTLEAAIGVKGKARVSAIRKSGQIVFHAVGDTGNVYGTNDQAVVADRMISDYDDPDSASRPSFFLHLGDVIYSFGERERYYDQFYDPYRDYPAPIVALAGHHDGMVAPSSSNPTLMGFLYNFCAAARRRTDEAGDVDRDAQVQPGVYFTMEAPFVRILALYSNCLAGAGVISKEGKKYPDLGDEQLAFLTAALKRIKDEGYSGAVVVAVHHPPYCVRGRTAGRGDSRSMLKDIDGVCEAVGVWPHAVLSAHSDNYQRFTRFKDVRETPYIVAGNGGHAIDPLAGAKCSHTPCTYVLRGAAENTEKVTLDRFDDQSFGFLRIAVNAQRLLIEYQRASGDTFDSVVVNLATRKLVTAFAS